MLVQPTSPLRKSEDIDKVIKLLFLKEAKAIVSVCEVDHHPLWANTLPEDGWVYERFYKTRNYE